MSARPKPAWTREDYDRDADEYMARLPSEHFMESTPQAAQRKVALASLEQVETLRQGFRCFNELLVHWRPGESVRHVVPDNVVVLDFEGEFPVGSTGKVRKAEVREWVVARVTGAARP